MKNRTRITQFAAVAAIVAGTAGVVAEQSQAARSQNHPQLRRGVLKVEGTAASDENRAPPEGRSARHPPDRPR